MPAITETTEPYEILVRYESGEFKGAHYVERTVIQRDGVEIHSTTSAAQPIPADSPLFEAAGLDAINRVGVVEVELASEKSWHEATQAELSKAQAAYAATQAKLAATQAELAQTQAAHAAAQAELTAEQAAHEATQAELAEAQAVIATAPETSQ